MSKGPVRPEDILPDDVNTTEAQGLKARKGTIAAILANISLIESEVLDAEEKQAILEMIKELAPIAIAIGLNDHVYWKNKEVQEIFDGISRGKE